MLIIKMSKYINERIMIAKHDDEINVLLKKK